MLYSYVVEGTHHDTEPFLHLLVGQVWGLQASRCLLKPLSQFVLDQNEGFHGVVQSQVVLVHLREDGADVQVDLARIADDKALLHADVLRTPVFQWAEIKALVLYL